jgi:hypothetical protein
MINVVKEAVERAIRDMTLAVEDDGHILLSVPVYYPSGGLALLSIAGGQHTVTVSDRGMGFYEAELFGADAAYARVAKSAAEKFGVRFDGQSLLALEVPISAIAGAIAAVANASCVAASDAVRVDSEYKAEKRNEEVYQRVRLAFPDAHVSRKLTVSGGRAEWEAHNVVQLSGRTAIFEPVAPSMASISAKFTMFSDLSKREDLLLAALVEHPEKLVGKGQLLYDVARVLPATATPETLKQLAA